MDLDTKVINKACSGKLIRSCEEDKASNVQIDSRLAGRDSVFFALKGSTNDGSDYVSQAVDKGARIVIIDSASEEKVLRGLGDRHANVISVRDSAQALMDLAGYCYSRLSIRTAGISGSCGKTTTKELTAAILEQMGPTCKNPGNYNSTTGLPLAMLMAQPGSMYGVFEIGIDHIGEMDRMVEALKPQSSLLTAIGPAHLGNFKDLETVAEEKTRLFAPGQSAFAYDGIAFKKKVLSSCPDINFYGLGDIYDIQDRGLDGWSFSYQGVRIRLSLIGRHCLADAVGAIRLAQNMGASLEAIKTGLESVKAINGRSRVIWTKDSCLIDDTYNANLSSFMPILGFVQDLPYCGRKVAALGSMSELGAATENLHIELGKRLSRTSLDQYYLYGEAMKSAYEMLQKAHKSAYWSTEIENVKDAMMDRRKKGDLLLVKGSRVMKMERLIEAMEAV
ncbi:MAG: UDP-N-acetylmuramoyl-tripeptide--D-alanyl-D-alanine ligase [Sphaerochaetaceae bacterium]